MANELLMRFNNPNWKSITKNARRKEKKKKNEQMKTVFKRNGPVPSSCAVSNIVSRGGGNSMKVMQAAPTHTKKRPFQSAIPTEHLVEGKKENLSFDAHGKA